MKQQKYAGGRVAGLIALNLAFLAAIGCEGVELAVGQTGAALDLEHCYGAGTECSSSVTAVKGSMPEVQSCSETDLGELERDQSFTLKFTNSCPVAPIKVANDGTIWALESEGAPVVVGSGSYCDTTYQYLHLTRYSADGTVLGHTPALFPQFGEVRSFSLNVDAAGNAVLTYGEVSGASGTGPYAVSSLDGTTGIVSTGPYPVAPSVDGEIDVATTIRSFDAQLQQVGETLVLRGLENPQLVPAEPSVFTIAGTRITTRPCSAGNGGDSLGGDEGTTPGCYVPPWVSNPARASTGSSTSAQGVLLRLRNEAPDFVQAHATDAEWGAASSVGGMVVGDANCSFVLRHQPDPNTAAVLPLSSLLRFDAQGNVVWELELPGDVDYPSVLAVADGGVIVDDGTLPNRVFHVSSGGVIDWAYQVDSTQDFVTDPISRMAYTLHRRWIDGTSQGYSLVTISGDGSRCEMYGLADSQSTDAKADSVTTVVHSPYVYLQRVTDIRRYRLPTP